MGQKLVIGPISKGLRNDVTSFNVDNDAFPTLVNAYQWRGRIKRKRGTLPFTRLSIQQIGLFNATTLISYYNSIGNTTNPGGAIVNYDIKTNFSLASYTSIAPFSIRIIVNGGTPQVYTDNGLGILVPTAPATGAGTINYQTGIFSLQTAPVLANTATYLLFSYYPSRPVLGLEPFVEDASQTPKEIGFDTTRSYNISLSIGANNLEFAPYLSWDVSYYNNPATKNNWTPVRWNLDTYQQMWTTNYAGAMWAVPGIRSTFDSAVVGMPFKRLTSATAVGAPVTDVDFVTTQDHCFVPGDYIFVNETNNLTGMNFQTGVVLAAPAITATTFRARFPNAVIAAGPANTGIVQALTTSCEPDGDSTVPTYTQDCIRWYNGAPVTGATPPAFANEKGWVNFCPPLLSGSDNTFSIADLPVGQYYLVGARMVVPFKDRLLFFGPIVQTSSGTSKYLQDTVIYSQNGTPYYTVSFTGSISATTQYFPQLVPTNQTAQPTAWFENTTGFGGFLNAGYARPITTVSINEDALIVGFSDRQARLLYTGNDIIPFNFYIINSELGSDSTFSSITLDRGVLSMGGRGIILTSQTASQRIDLDIPGEIFELNINDKGSFRACAARDFQNEWIYFTFPYSSPTNVFPNATFLYNYRDGTWAQFYECYTTYGLVRTTDGYIWSTLPYNSWDEWSDPWNSGSSTEGQPLVCAGNPQGFVVFKGISTDESPSAYIESFSGNTITSTNHCLNTNDFVFISGCLGTISQQVNGKIFQIEGVTNTTFSLQGASVTGTYLGNGLITRLYRPFIQSRQFPTAWEMGRKTRIGPQQYLLSYTDKSQISLLIYLSQSSSTAYNDSTIVPDPTSSNNSLIYSTTLYTCPETTNLGLTPSNTNLQMLTSTQQSQIWHRMNTSLIGDTVQIGFTISDEQMGMYIEEDTSYPLSAISNAYPCVVTTTNQFATGVLVKIQDVLGMTEINFSDALFNYYEVISSTPSGDNFLVSLNIDSTAYGVFVTSPDATITQVNAPNATAEVEIHSMILDLQPSQLLA